jgi:hypothetical protein
VLLRAAESAVAKRPPDEPQPPSPYRFGAGLSSCFHLTDCIQILADDRLYIVDPLAKVLTVDSATTKPMKSHKKAAPAASVGVANGYRFVGTDLKQKFPDQFRPFSALPFGFDVGVDAPYRGTIIRLPLRLEASDLSEYCLGDKLPAVPAVNAFSSRGSSAATPSVASNLSTVFFNHLAPVFASLPLFAVYIEGSTLVLQPAVEGSAPVVVVLNQLLNAGESPCSLVMHTV